jgi:hypothetical protein
MIHFLRKNFREIKFSLQRYVQGDEYVLQEYIPLETNRYEVTNKCESCAIALSSCCCAGWHREWLIMTDRAVTWKRKDLLGTSRKRLPYAQLGYLEIVRVRDMAYISFF